MEFRIRMSHPCKDRKEQRVSETDECRAHMGSLCVPKESLREDCYSVVSPRLEMMARLDQRQCQPFTGYAMTISLSNNARGFQLSIFIEAGQCGLLEDTFVWFPKASVSLGNLTKIWNLHLSGDFLQQSL